MLSKLFKCHDGMDFLDDLILQFYDCELLVAIHPYGVGERVNIIVADLNRGKLQLFKGNTIINEVSLKLEIGA